MSASTGTDWDRGAALTTAHILLEIGAVNLRPDAPYTLTSGWCSPVYIDCRRIIYFPRARSKICELGVEKINRHVGYESIEVVAGGETAGIPFAAWIADRMSTPMAYIRKKPKGFGRNALIEGDVPEGRRTLLLKTSPPTGRPRCSSPSLCGMQGPFAITLSSSSTMACFPAARSCCSHWTFSCITYARGGTCWRPARIVPTSRNPTLPTCGGFWKTRSVGRRLMAAWPRQRKPRHASSAR